MYLLNEKLRNFFVTFMISVLLSFIVYLYINANLVYAMALSRFFLVYSISFYIIFFVYAIYPLVKILFKNYGSFIQKVLVILILISLVFLFLFSKGIFTLVLILYLAIFLNFSSNVEEERMYCILSYPLEKDRHNRDFGEMVNSSLFNVLMTVVLLIIVSVESLYYFDLYIILSTILSVVFVMSSIIYGKLDKSFN